ncbi:MAG: hydroxylamine reductase, partial [Eubacteriales bacterium]|nr:hydroxylamine reductase [Eubacteriales bacterium]
MMFCFQCQETAKGTGCEVRGVCGKTEDVAKLQDLLIYSLKGIADIINKEKMDVSKLGNINHEVIKSLFMTITNANFDADALEKQIDEMILLRDSLKSKSASGSF